MQQPDALGRNGPISSRVYLGPAVHCRTVDEGHDIGVLLDGARFPEVRKHRGFIGSFLYFARQLRQQDNRNIEFLCEQFCRTAGGGDLPLAGAVRVPACRVEQLQIVDNDHPAPSPAGHSLTLRAYIPHRNIGPVIEVNRQRGKFRGGLFEPAPAVGVYIARSERSGINSRTSYQHSPGQLCIGHLQRKHAHRNPGSRCGVGEMEHYGRFAHTGPASQHDKLATPPAARKGIEAGQSRRYADTLPGLAGLLPAFQVVEGGPHDLRKRRNIVGVYRCGGYGGYFRRGPVYDTVRIGDSARREFVAE